ncbi:MAG: glycerol-3-phosphate acyltransferase [Rickettsiales bacterium]|jgi:glycerol-3-phosphate acyltransferase PlsY|nr:glycerol-3-phosphate acyltransferase [Rickettsiales bacterium]
MVFLLGFLLSGVPFGYLITKLVKKVDIRNYGSGNIGATNVWRVLGIKYAILTFILDGSKSLIPILLIRKITGDNTTQVVSMLLLAVAGHIFSPWLGWSGGKGFSSFILGLVALDIRLFLAAALAWLIVFLMFRISGLATLVSMTTTLVSSYSILSASDLLIMAMICTMIFWAHRKNIKNLIFPIKRRVKP